MLIELDNTRVYRPVFDYLTDALALVILSVSEGSDVMGAVRRFSKPLGAKQVPIYRARRRFIGPNTAST